MNQTMSAFRGSRLVGAITIVLFMLNYGCSHSYYIRSPDVEILRSFNDRAYENRCTMFLDDGSTFEARNLTLAADTTTWFDIEMAETSRISTRKIDRIVFIDRSDGFMEGMGWGFVAGTAFIGGVILASGDCDAGTEFCIDDEEAFMIGLVIVSLPAALVGGAIGAGIGSKHVYFIFPDESVSETGDQVDAGRRQPVRSPGR